MKELERIKEIKKAFDDVYAMCLNRYDAGKSILKNNLVNEGYSIGEDESFLNIFIGDYVFLTENSTIYKRI